MEFANATYLWGLLGVLLPIAIHLWNRKKEQTIKVGSTKLLQASDPKQTNSIRLNEWWLLLLRMAAIALLAFILAEPSIKESIKNRKVVYLVEPSLVQDNRISAMLDSLPSGSLKLLEKGFPEWDAKEIINTETPNYWQLAQEMPQISADSLVVFASGMLKGVKGSRPQIQANTNWIIIEPEATKEKPLFAEKKEGYFQIHSVSSNASQFSFLRDSISDSSTNIEMNKAGDSLVLKFGETLSRIPIHENKSIRVGVTYPDSLQMQFAYIKAAYSAISKYIQQPIEVVHLKEPYDVTSIDFSTVISFDSVATNGSKTTWMQYRPNPLANSLIEKGRTQNTFYLTEKLNSENIVEEQFPEQLVQLLGGYSNVNSKANDRRVIAANELQTSYVKKEGSHKARIVPLSKWLWLLLVVILFVERLIAKLRKQ